MSCLPVGAANPSAWLQYYNSNPEFLVDILTRKVAAGRCHGTMKMTCCIFTSGAC